MAAGTPPRLRTGIVRPDSNRSPTRSDSLPSPHTRAHSIHAKFTSTKLPHDSLEANPNQAVPGSAKLILPWPPERRRIFPPVASAGRPAARTASVRSATICFYKSCAVSTPAPRSPGAWPTSPASCPCWISKSPTHCRRATGDASSSSARPGERINYVISAATW